MRIRYLLAGTALGCCAVAMPSLAWAQTAPAEETGKRAADAEVSADPEESEEAEDIVVTGSFLDTGAQSATKLDVRALDVPLTVSSYSEAFLDAIEATRVSDLYKYMTGVQRSGRSGVSIILRGFASSNNDRNAIMTDGLPGLSGRQSPSTATTDHVEVVKGPASILYGQVQPGGFVNIITKKPSARASNEVEFSFEKGIGSLDRAVGGVVSFDSTGALNDSATVLYRVIGEAGYSKGFRDFYHEQPILIAPSLAFDLGRTKITLLAEYQRVREQYDSFLVAPGENVANVAPINTSYQEATDSEVNEGGAGTVLVQHELNSAISFNGALRYVHGDNMVEVFEPINFRNATTIGRRARRQHNVRTYGFGDVNMNAKFELGGIEVTSVIGFNYGRETSDLNRLQFFNGPATGPNSLDMNVLNPVHGAVRPLETYPLFASAANLTHRIGSTIASGVYFSSLIELTDQIKTMVGLRYAREKISVREVRLPGATPTGAVNEAWLPMIGLLYQPVENISFYTSYSTSFSPVQPTAVDRNGVYSFKPTTGNSIEGGVKAELFDRRLKMTAAYFDIRKKDTINSFQSPGGTIAEQIGEERANGFELEVDAKATRNWQIIGGLARVHPRITKSNIPNQVGAILENAARTSAQVFSRYNFDAGALAGFGVGLGVSHTGSRPGILPTLTSTNVLRLPANTTADTAVYYEAEAFSVTAKIANIFDERYFENVGTSGATQVQPGQPRTASLTLRYNF